MNMKNIEAFTYLKILVTLYSEYNLRTMRRHNFGLNRKSKTYHGSSIVIEMWYYLTALRRFEQLG